MNHARRLLPELGKSGNVATITVVVLAYVVLILSYVADIQTGSGAPFSVGTLLLAIGLGVVYLWLFLGGYEALQPLLGRYATAGLFILALGLMLAIEFLVGGRGGIWLISMPLVATAVTELSPRWRWVVYAIVFAGMALPIWISSGDWREALFNALTFSPAIVFVVVFVRLTQQAEEAQAQSEALAAELETANRALSAYAVQAEEMATVQERNRLAGEIHDNLGHYLTVAIVQIKAAQAVMAKDPARATAALEKAQQLTEDGLKAVRQSVSALRESPLHGRSLPDAITGLAADTQAGGIVCEVSVQGTPHPLDPRAELTLYRAAQEALTNVRKHARASRVDIALNYAGDGTVALRVADNGVGPADGVGTNDGQAGGFGLLGLRERVRQLGGHVTIDTGVGRGFCLEVTVPGDAPAPVGPPTPTGEHA